MADEQPRMSRAELEAENAELRRQLAKAPPVGPVAGTLLHYRRGAERVCRPAEMVSDGYVDELQRHSGSVCYALIGYGDVPVAGQDAAQAAIHRFQVNRAHSTIGEPDTWHLASACPFQADVQAP